MPIIGRIDCAHAADWGQERRSDAPDLRPVSGVDVAVRLPVGDVGEWWHAADRSRPGRRR